MSVCDSESGGKKQRKKWDHENMKRAVLAVKNKEMGYLKAKKTYGVPKSTLERYVNSNQPINELIETNLGRKSDLPPEMEELLVKYCLEVENRFYGLRASDIRRLAFQIAEKNNLQNVRFKDGKAGKKWLRLFMRRHPVLSFRKPQAISGARAKGFTQENVNNFFDIYEKELEAVGNNPHRVYNVDETGTTVVQHKTSRVIALKGKKQISTISSAERGSLITLVTCMSAGGHSVPPMFVFPRKNMKHELLNGAPPGSIADCHISGWIQSESFTKWLDHFIQHTKPALEDPVILILDGHYSHTRNMDIIDIGREKGVKIVCLPPHSTHKMQPLDVAFMSSFKTFYAQEIETWLRANPNRLVTAFQIAELVGKAYARSATLENAIGGFKKTGLFPCNRNVFRDHEFAVTNSDETVQPLEKEQSPSPMIVTPEEISPLPTMSKKHQSTRGRKAGKAALITGSPYKKELELSLQKIKKGPQQLEEENQPSTSKVRILSNKIVEKCKVCKNLIIKNELKCGQCKFSFHYKCVPRQHKDNIPESDEEDSYVCHECYNLESDDSVSTDELFSMVR